MDKKVNNSRISECKLSTIYQIYTMLWLIFGIYRD